ncbi:MAG: cobalamin-binding protein [Candidatus Bathyarchaeota archaeon]|nr:cobalamin-binding protein [Candidatus Termiticorpusculum sp.]
MNKSMTIVAIVLIALIASAATYVIYTEYIASPNAPTSESPTQQSGQTQTSPSTSAKTPISSPTQTNANSENKESSGTSTSNTDTNTNQNTTPAFPVTVTDDEGVKVTITSAPKRVVSLAPSITETVFAAGAGDQVIGVTDYCNYPYNFKAWITAGNMSTVGNYWQPAIEPIMALNPDLIFASGDGASNDAAYKLRDLGYTVIVLNPTSVDKILNNIDVIGKATGNADKAAATINSLQARIDAITTKVEDITDKPNVCYLTGSYAAGADSFLHSLIVLAGGVNVFGDINAAYPQVSNEIVIAKNPDVIITSTSINSLQARAGWSNINAIANGRVYSPYNYDAYSRSGPRFIDVLEDIANMLHPELFSK